MAKRNVDAVRAWIESLQMAEGVRDQIEMDVEVIIGERGLDPERLVRIVAAYPETEPSSSTPASPEIATEREECPACGSGSREMRWCSNPSHGKVVHAVVRFECTTCTSIWHDLTAQEVLCGTARHAATSTIEDSRLTANSACASEAPLLPDEEWNHLSLESRGKLATWFRLATERLQLILDEPPTLASPPTEPTVEDGIGLLRKIEGCTGDAAKLILLKNFVLRSVRAASTGTGWIPVSERLPEIAQLAILLVEGEVITGRRFEMGNGWYWTTVLEDGESFPFNPEQVTDWQPLPAPPVASQKGKEEE